LEAGYEEQESGISLTSNWRDGGQVNLAGPYRRSRVQREEDFLEKCIFLPWKGTTFLFTAGDFDDSR
jgi:hypothetical protein